MFGIKRKKNKGKKNYFKEDISTFTVDGTEYTLKIIVREFKNSILSISIVYYPDGTIMKSNLDYVETPFTKKLDMSRNEFRRMRDVLTTNPYISDDELEVEFAYAEYI